MDWEGGTIGVIVPALMGHGEAGRASPWPFFMRSELFDAAIAFCVGSAHQFFDVAIDDSLSSS